jgi:hypothetical protein
MARTYLLLLDMLRGKQTKELELTSQGNEDVTASLQRELSDRRCLIWLDNVHQKEVLTAFRTSGFLGALLVTAHGQDIWEGLPDHRKVHISNDIFWAAPDNPKVDEEDKIASRILAMRAANDKNVTQFPPGCEVGHICRHGASGSGRMTTFPHLLWRLLWRC